MSLASIHRRNAELHPDKVAFSFAGKEITFSQYLDRGDRLARALRAHGVRRQDRVAVFARNSFEILETYAAADLSGCIIAPLNFRLVESELVHLLTRLRPKALIVQGYFIELLESVRGRLPFELLAVGFGAEALPAGWVEYEHFLEEPSDGTEYDEAKPIDYEAFIYTSGTTGVPRAAMLTHGGQWASAQTLAMEMALVPTDVHLSIMPLYHAGGRAIVLAHTFRGCTVVVGDGWDTEAALRMLWEQGVTTTQVVPAMVTWLLDRADLKEWDLSKLRLVWYASAPMPVTLLKRAIAEFGPIFMQGYGQTEAGPLVTVMHIHEHVTEGPAVKRLASCGRPALNCEVRIVDENDADVPVGQVGELIARSPSIMTGYYDLPEESATTLRNGWLHTSDLGYRDGDGYIYLVDRKRDMVISGGENVYPREIEEVLFAHPAVSEAAVIGVPDDVWGEAVKAYVVLRADVGKPSDRLVAELMAFCRERLAGYKRPKSLEIFPELPKNPSGKVLKGELRALAGTDAGRQPPTLNRRGECGR